jgi:hypothetical protein
MNPIPPDISPEEWEQIPPSVREKLLQQQQTAADPVPLRTITPLLPVLRRVDRAVAWGTAQATRNQPFHDGRDHDIADSMGCVLQWTLTDFWHGTTDLHWTGARVLRGSSSNPLWGRQLEATSRIKGDATSRSVITSVSAACGWRIEINSCY